jgi:hypothetical protein
VTKFYKCFTHRYARTCLLVRTLVPTRLCATACVVLCSASACASLGKTPPHPDLQPWPEIRSDFPVEPLRARMQEYSITFAAEVDRTATAIERRASDATVRRNAQLWKLRAVPEMRKACFRPGPLVALIDAWILARQMDQFFTDGAGAGAFGAFQPEAVEATRRLVSQLRAIGDSVSVSHEATAELERTVVDPWLLQHPLHDLTFARESPIARFADLTRTRGDAFESVGSIEEVLASLSTQLRIYLSDLPRQVRGEIDLLRADALPPDDFASMQRDLHTSAAAVSQIAGIVGGVPDLIRGERQLAFDEVGRQRVLVMDGVAGERTQVIAAMTRMVAAERDLLLRDVEWQRRATLEWATGERREATAAVRQHIADALIALRRERTTLVDDMRRLVDVVSLRVTLFVIFAVVLAPLIAHVYVRVWPRRRRGPESP